MKKILVVCSLIISLMVVGSFSVSCSKKPKAAEETAMEKDSETGEAKPS